MFNAITVLRDIIVRGTIPVHFSIAKRDALRAMAVIRCFDGEPISIYGSTSGSDLLNLTGNLSVNVRVPIREYIGFRRAILDYPVCAKKLRSNPFVRKMGFL